MRGDSPAASPAASTVAAAPAAAAPEPEAQPAAGGPPAVFLDAETVLERQWRVYPMAAGVE
eukprot:6030949-Pyramimonas_sp.AAC.1